MISGHEKRSPRMAQGQSRLPRGSRLYPVVGACFHRKRNLDVAAEPLRREQHRSRHIPRARAPRTRRTSMWLARSCASTCTGCCSLMPARRQRRRSPRGTAPLVRLAERRWFVRRAVRTPALTSRPATRFASPRTPLPLEISSQARHDVARGCGSGSGGSGTASIFSVTRFCGCSELEHLRRYFNEAGALVQAWSRIAPPASCSGRNRLRNAVAKLGPSNSQVLGGPRGALDPDAELPRGPLPPARSDR